MLFNTLAFCLFLTLVLILYWSVSHRFRKLLLITASVIFYGWWDVRFLLLITLSIFIDYFCGLRLEEEKNNSKRKWFLYLSVSANLLILCVFKYFNFFIDSLNLLIKSLNYSGSVQNLDIILPVGISFYTFQSLSYTIDVYFNKIKATKSISNFYLYVIFFPQLVAGPIVRAKKFLPQINVIKKFNHKRMMLGFHFVLLGLFKKMVIADNLAPFVDRYFESVSLGTMKQWEAVYAFSIQIYADFSGYTLIAIGVAMMLGFRIGSNFHYPYISSSLKEFWSRWHISLSSWFRDYVYIPLGGNQSRTRSILYTFILSGIWHGANWLFLLWGFVHSFFLLIEKKIRLPHQFYRAIKVFILFHLICLLWVFFRSETLFQSLSIFRNLFSFSGEAKINLTIIFIILPIAIEHLIAYFGFDPSFKKFIHQRKITVIWALLLFVIVQFRGIGQKFIYFQF